MTSEVRHVAAVFVLNGLLFACLVTRIPDIREGLDLDNAALGLLLLTIALGSMLSLPSSGWLIQRSSPGRVVRTGAVLCAAGMVLAAAGVTVVDGVPLTAAGLFAYGLGTGAWDVAQNVEGAEVERRLGRTVMPRFHAGWSIGSIVGAGLGVATTAASVPMLVHLGVASLAVLVGVVAAAGRFVPVEHEEPTDRSAAGGAWAEPRILAIGVMVLSFAVAEGSANDWLSLAIIDGYDTRQWVGVAGFAGFVCAMTTGRLLGPALLDRFGRAPVLWVSSGATALGVLLVVFGGGSVLVGVGILVWGLGAALGFPVGMSAAADDPARAAARVSVVSTIGYGAFLAGPPLLGALGDRVGTLESLLVVAGLMAPAALAVTTARPRTDVDRLPT